jgi:hypothetical protein
MKMEQIIEMLVKINANQKELKEGTKANQAKTDTNHKETMAKTDAWIDGMEACVEKVDANPEDMKSAAAQKENPRSMPQ